MSFHFTCFVCFVCCPIMKRLIGFVAAKQHGKTLGSEYLSHKYGYKIVSFSDPLKRALKEIFDFSDEQLWGSQKESIDPFWGLTPRFVMQMVGTDFFRVQMKQKVPHIGDQIWVKVAEKRIRQYLDSGQNVVVDDVRFLNESNLIHQMGGYLIRIERPMMHLSIDSHESEQHIKEISVDRIIINDSSIDHYNQQLDQVVDAHSSIGVVSI